MAGWWGTHTLRRVGPAQVTEEAKLPHTVLSSSLWQMRSVWRLFLLLLSGVWSGRAQPRSARPALQDQGAVPAARVDAARRGCTPLWLRDMPWGVSS